MNGQRRLRILVAKPGLDGHDRGARVIARAFRDAGFEVVYTGCHQTPEQIVHTAVQEDVDVVGLSILSGAHLPIAEKLVNHMQTSGIGKVPVFVGGNIPARDHDRLRELGVAGVFGTGSELGAIAEAVRNCVGERSNG